MSEKLIALFKRRYGRAPQHLVRSPGRVNLIGEHTDYNDGWVLPMAIDRAIWIAFTPRHDDRVEVYAADYKEAATFSLGSLEADGPTWAAYIKGVAYELQSAGAELCGWQGIIAGEIPIAAGLSSSAAMELAAARVFAYCSELSWDPLEMARLCQRAENHWVGVQCGIMDQLTSAAAVAASALLLDCRTLEMIPVALPSDVTVIVMDSGVRRELAVSAYNERRRECAQAAQQLLPGEQPSLRDLTAEILAQRGDQLDECLLGRAKHVYSENRRTLAAVEAMYAGNAHEFGELLNASHASLRDDFEVSCPELDNLTEGARGHPSCFGARLTGAGFGGCALALIGADATADFIRHMTSEYQARTGRVLKAWPCQAAPGTELI